MDQAVVALAQLVATIGPTALLALGFILLVIGVIRPGTLVDAERERIIKERDAREVAIVAEYQRREIALTKERDEWRDRSRATDDRLDRVSGAFERLAKAPAPE